MAVTDTGTCFGGQIDLEVQMPADGNSVTVRAKSGKLSVQPKEIRIRLRSGDGRPLGTATVNGQATPVQAGDVVLLPVQTDGSFEVVGKFD